MKALEGRIARLEAAVERIERLLAPSPNAPIPEALRDARWRQSAEDLRRVQNRGSRQTLMLILGNSKQWEARRGSLPASDIDAKLRRNERDIAKILNELWDRGYRLRLHGCKKTVRPAIAH